MTSPTKAKLEIKPNDSRIRSSHNFMPGVEYESFNNTLRPHNYFTLKGRLEVRKDYKGVLWAASQTPSVTSVRYEDGDGNSDMTVSISWCIDYDWFGNDIEKSENIIRESIDIFIEKLEEVRQDKVEVFKDMGLEPHVFIQSLKPIDKFDGERNGCYGYWWT